MNKIKLQPFTKILKQEYALNPDDLTRYSVPLNYIDARLKEIHELTPSNAPLDEETKILHAKLIRIRERVNKTSAEYSKLNEAILRLQKNYEDMDSLVKETQDTWENLQKVEEKLSANASQKA